jgi:predicted Zn-dependent protease
MNRWMDAPATLYDSRRFLSEEECTRLTDRVFDMAKGGGFTAVRLVSTWTGSARWGRNRVSVAGDQRDNSEAWVFRALSGAGAFSVTNQIDDESLMAAVRNAERSSRMLPGSPDAIDEPAVRHEFAKPTIWSDATYDVDAATRGEIVRAVIDPAEAAGMLSAGYLSAQARGTSFSLSTGTRLYAQSTEAQCSVTVRDAKGLGSGWAGLSTYDWAKLDAPAIGARALDKCRRSLNPVVVEPGRYTVILEPQAVRDLVALIVASVARTQAEDGRGPFAAERGFSKLGKKVIDARVTIGHDLMDPLLGVLPFELEEGGPVRPVNWIEHGVLTALSYERERYALPQLNENLGLPNVGAFRMSGGDTSVEEMIRTTQRGLLVTRFSNVKPLDPGSLLSTGVTRDGLWLIERGQITKTVKNLRFTESPLFMLNNLEQLGTPVPVFSPGAPTVVPALKARDFSFTSLVDAI